MPKTTRLFVKTSIAYLVLGAALGALLLINRWISLGTWILALRASHVEFLVVGWLTQLILGVAWWLFPPLNIGLRPGIPQPTRRGQTQRGSEPLFWATFVALNAGTLFRAIFEPLHIWTGASLYDVLATTSSLWLLLAAVGFVVNTWQRIRELGKPQQQAG